MEIIDKGLDPNDSSKYILEVNMSEHEATQLETLASQTGCSVEDLAIKILTSVVKNQENFTEQCAFMSFMDKNRKRNEG